MAANTDVMNATLTPSIVSIANGSNVTSAAITGTGETSIWQLIFTPTSSIAAGVTVNLWFVPSIDGGVTYADGGSTDPAGSLLAGVFVCASGTAKQTLQTPEIKLPRGVPFKAVISNKTGVAFSSATTHALSYTIPAFGR